MEQRSNGTQLAYRPVLGLRNALVTRIEAMAVRFAALLFSFYFPKRDELAFGPGCCFPCGS